MAGAVTVTGPGSPCAKYAWNTVSNPDGTGIPWSQRIAYDLCLATHKATELALDAWHWVWDELDALWHGLENLASGAWTATKDAVGKVAQGAKNLIQWLDDQAGKAESWLMWGAIIIAAIALSPAINDVVGVGSSYARKKSR
jgi:hypothetical protein